MGDASQPSARPRQPSATQTERRNQPQQQQNEMSKEAAAPIRRKKEPPPEKLVVGRKRERKRKKRKSQSWEEQIKMLHRASCGRSLAPLLLLALTLAASKAQSLRINSIEVSAAVMNSTPVTLACNYELQGDQLYSVKWYKNYVEFYRFQPTDQQQSSAMSADNQAAAAAAHSLSSSKQEFELEGINLNLSKSNATHVYLRQTSLASEGTYKCEVSADSPSFVTVSIERQMKVYVLPKQKLSIVDNSALVAGTGSLGHLTSSQQQQATGLLSGGGDTSGGQLAQSQRPLMMTTGTLLVYNINDIVNLTCISGPSKPAARLTWLLNDTPVSANSKWLTPQPYSSKTSPPSSFNSRTETTQQQQQLVESRLTLSFRLQPSHLLKTTTTNTTTTHNDHQQQQQQQQRIPQLRLRCLAKLSEEFASETSITLSGGKTTIKKRQPQAQAQLPAPSSLRSTGDAQRLSATADWRQQTADATRHNPSVATSDEEDSPPVYRWPRPMSAARPHRVSLAATAAMASRRRSAATAADGSEAVGDLEAGGGSAASDGGQQEEPLARGPPPAPSFRTAAAGNLASPRGSTMVMVWTGRQLRDQSEHIEQMLKVSRPNELEPPLIEAKSQVPRGDAAAAESADSSDDDETADAPDGTVLAAAAAEPVPTEHEESTARAPSATTEAGWPTEPEVPASGGGGSSDENWWPSSSPSNSGGNSAASTTTITTTDYELNDQIQFTCSSRHLGPMANGDPLLAPTTSVHLKWFINDKEITLNQVNAFDGSKFYYVQEYSAASNWLAAANRHRRPAAASSSQQQQQQLTTPAGDLVASETFAAPTTSHHKRPTWNITNSRQRQQQSSALQAAAAETSAQPTTIVSRSLVLELTASLLQLKELHLKCRTVVDQPLIEYESQLFASVPTSQFIQADSRHRTGGGSSILRPGQRQMGRVPGAGYHNQQQQARGKGWTSGGGPQRHQSSSAAPASIYCGWRCLFGGGHTTGLVAGFLSAAAGHYYYYYCYHWSSAAPVSGFLLAA